MTLVCESINYTDMRTNATAIATLVLLLGSGLLSRAVLCEPLCRRSLTDKQPPPPLSMKDTIIADTNIVVGQYFEFMEQVVAFLDTLKAYPISEYTLVHANPWILDTLRSYDYYESMKRGRFIYNQRVLPVLKKGARIKIPDKKEALAIQDSLEHTLIDVNIPEYKLRIIVYDSVRHTLPVRVGRNTSRYLKTAGRRVSLRTPIGEGQIIRIERNPWFVNPVDGKVYHTTLRDDGQRTRMPLIPWLEPAIAGRRPGTLIHPTTNSNTLGKAYSNGCIGTSEGDAWLVYYHAPLGTKVRFRYDLKVENEKGDTTILKDIYNLREDP